MAKQASTSRVARARLRQLDDALQAVQLPTQPAQGWVRTIRAALGMTQKQLGRRLSMTPQGVSELEKQETAGRITLDTQQRAAAELDCDLRYVLVPKTTLDDTVAQQAEKRATEKLRLVNAGQSLEGARLPSKRLSRTIEDLAAELKLERSRDLWDTV